MTWNLKTCQQLLIAFDIHIVTSQNTISRYPHPARKKEEKIGLQRLTNLAALNFHVQNPFQNLFLSPGKLLNHPNESCSHIIREVKTEAARILFHIISSSSLTQTRSVEAARRIDPSNLYTISQSITWSDSIHR